MVMVIAPCGAVIMMAVVMPHGATTVVIAVTVSGCAMVGSREGEWLHVHRQG